MVHEVPSYFNSTKLQSLLKHRGLRDVILYSVILCSFVLERKEVFGEIWFLD